MIADENMYKKMYMDMKEERDTLIDDLSWYKAKVSRLEQRISKLVSENTKLQNDLFSEQLIQDEADDKIKKLERENEKLKRKALGYDNMITGEMGELYKKARAFDNYMEDK